MRQQTYVHDTDYDYTPGKLVAFLHSCTTECVLTEAELIKMAKQILDETRHLVQTSPQIYRRTSDQWNPPLLRRS